MSALLSAELYDTNNLYANGYDAFNQLNLIIVSVDNTQTILKLELPNYILNENMIKINNNIFDIIINNNRTIITLNNNNLYSLESIKSTLFELLQILNKKNTLNKFFGVMYSYYGNIICYQGNINQICSSISHDQS